MTEERADGAHNGLTVVVVDMELEAATGSEAEGQLVPPAVELVSESVSPSSDTDVPVPLKEDPAQSSHSDAHLTSQDMRRAKRIRVRLLCSAKCNSALDTFVIWCHSGHVGFTTVCLFPQCVLPSKMDVQVGRTRRMAEKNPFASKIPFVISPWCYYSCDVSGYSPSLHTLLHPSASSHVRADPCQ